MTIHFMHVRSMTTESSIEWTGIGKWLSFASAGLLILLAIPFIFDHGNGAVAGWNIFLGLLLIGAIASGNARAPTIAMVIAGIMAVRLVVAVAIGAGAVDVVIGIAVLAVVGISAWDLRKQKAQF
ncbi:hypothetical protein ACM61V_11195 [Sphingomonas sp. TX0543]|uniref:hypothetical protein n=2 Tax=unclassified Sphingomonas TaxID=196159 RepID=UPI0010F76288|nr:hypothetical protein [Sphingomonas sp. 3P27F8]